MGSMSTSEKALQAADPVPATTIDAHGKFMRANRGKRVRPSSEFVDSSTLKIDDSDGESQHGQAPKKKRKGELGADDDNESASEVEDLGHDSDGESLPPTPSRLSPLPEVPAAIKEPELPVLNVQLAARTMTTQATALADILQNQPLELTVDIPKGTTGACRVTVNFEYLLGPDRHSFASTELGSAGQPATTAFSVSSVSGPGTGMFFGKSYSNASMKTGFLDLPAELRNRVYRVIFLGKAFNIGARQDKFARSSAILSSCKQVYNEGRTILYGENDFGFEREPGARARFWDGKWTEVGYTDCRRFLEMIGPHNISLLKKVGFSFEDACPSATPNLTREERRFVNDKHVHWMIATFARYGKLEVLTLGFFGRRQLYSTQDLDFLTRWKKVKTDVLKFGHPRIEGDNRYDFPYMIRNYRVPHDTVKKLLEGWMLRTVKSDPDPVYDSFADFSKFLRRSPSF